MTKPTQMAMSVLGQQRAQDEREAWESGQTGSPDQVTLGLCPEREVGFRHTWRNKGSNSSNWKHWNMRAPELLGTTASWYLQNLRGGWRDSRGGLRKTLMSSLDIHLKAVGNHLWGFNQKWKYHISIFGRPLGKRCDTHPCCGGGRESGNKTGARDTS